jgi:hypothetical protein
MLRIIEWGYPAFRSPYVGPNSLTPWAQTRNTWTTSAFLGLRLWDGGELYYNPELLQRMRFCRFHALVIVAAIRPPGERLQERIVLP